MIGLIVVKVQLIKFIGSEASYNMDLGQVFTKQKVAQYMVSLFELDKESLILDPCFGEGAFIKACINQGYKNITGYELDSSLFSDVQIKMSSLKLFNENFLSANTTVEYDGIVMNPPYIRQEKIDDLKCYGITKDILRQNDIFADLPRTANMYMYFILKGIELLKDSGQMIVIFPSSWLQARSGKTFAKSLYSKCTLKRQIFISGDVFEKDALVDVVIMVLVKGKVTFEPQVKKLEIINEQFIDKKCGINEDNLLFDIEFSNYARVRRGLTTGFNTMFINPKFTGEVAEEVLVPIISSPKVIRGYSTEDAITDKLFALAENDLLNGTISEYICTWKEKIELAGAPKTLCEKIKRSDFWYTIKIFNSKGILFSYFIRNDMKFIDNEAGTLARDNFYIIYPKIKKDLMFAMLNNYYTYYQLEKLGKKYGAGLLKLQRYDIEELKFPNIAQMTDYDQEQLCNYANLLISNGDSNYIDDITRIISKYSNVDYSEITMHYNKIKKHRLEGYAYGD